MIKKPKQKGKQYPPGVVCLPEARIKQILDGHKNDSMEPWKIFRIMAEFVSGFDFLKRYDKAVTFFGSARKGFESSVYQEAYKLAYKLAKSGYAVISGGGPGIMEAANHGAYDAKGRSVGLNIKLPTEQRINKYVQESEAFDFFFTRKTMLSFASHIYVFFPGGFGTLDELLELVTLIQTQKIPAIPIILVNKEYWTPFLTWVRDCIYKQNRAIDEADMSIYTLVDDADEAMVLIKQLEKDGRIQ